jgi:hypothetical protein
MKLRTLIAALAFCALAPLPALAATAGQPAPNFTLTDTQGKAVQLSDFKGKYVVLEWTNPGCPFVRNHYNTRNMQALQASWGPRGVVWLSIDSSNRTSFDFMPPAKLGEWMQARGAAQNAVLVDPDSAAAKLYQAKTTPHMFVIDPQGKIIYAGAIDDRPSTRPEDPPAANNYVRAALTQATGGMPVATAATTPYGCSIKY